MKKSGHPGIGIWKLLTEAWLDRGVIYNNNSSSRSLTFDKARKPHKIAKAKTIFFNKLQHTDNPILRTLFHLPTVKYEILGLAAKYGLTGVQGSLSAMKDCVWTYFVQKV